MPEPSLYWSDTDTDKSLASVITNDRLRSANGLQKSYVVETNELIIRSYFTCNIFERTVSEQ